MAHLHVGIIKVVLREETLVTKIEYGCIPVADGRTEHEVNRMARSIELLCVRKKQHSNTGKTQNHQPPDHDELQQSRGHD